MTDEQIIKEYQEFVKSVNAGGKGEIAQGRFGDILDLINRQKVKINEQDKEILKLQKRIIFWRDDLNYQPEKIKSETIKEFVERLKEHSFVDNLSLDGKETVYVDDIDNLVKEMTKGEKHE